MFRFFFTSLCLVVCLVCLYAATTIAPTMGWPTTSQEWLAAQLVVIGLLAKFTGLLAMRLGFERVC